MMMMMMMATTPLSLSACLRRRACLWWRGLGAALAVLAPQLDPESDGPVLPTSEKEEYR